MSHILVLNGSARPNAFTAAMIRSFCKGAESVGHTGHGQTIAVHCCNNGGVYLFHDKIKILFCCHSITLF